MKKRLFIYIAPVILFTLFSQDSLSQGWTISANFDSGVLGTKADNGGDGFTGAGGKSFYTNEQFLSGGQACELNIDSGKTGYGSWGGEFIFPKKVTRGDTIWYQVYTYFPFDFDHYSYGEGSRLKFLRIHTRSSTGKNHGYNDLYIDRHDDPIPFKWIYEGENRWVNVGQPSDSIVPDKWESYQMRITFDSIPLSEGGLAETFIWKNGILLKHITDRKTFKEAGDFSQRALLFTYWNGGSPKTQSMYVDEITITTELPSGVDAQGNRMIPSLINTGTTSVKDFSETELKIYPNPFQNELTVEGIPRSNLATLTIKSILGKEVEIDKNQQKNDAINISTIHLPVGIYFLTISYDNQKSTHKIIKN